MQWALVSTSPSGETNEPEQPPARRTEAFITRSTHAASGLKPYCARMVSSGSLSSVHMPSAPWALPAARVSSRGSSMRIGRLRRKGRSAMIPVQRSSPRAQNRQGKRS